MKTRILVVEDEPSWRDLIGEVLSAKGYQVTSVDNADSAMQEIRRATPALLLLDVKLEGISGLQLCEWLRKDPTTAALPILMLTTLQKESDKVRGLEIGADDYLTKPFSHAELAARIAALLRRARPGESPDRTIGAKGLVINLERHEVTVKGKQVELRPKEFDLLVLLVQKKGRVLNREFLSEAIWGRDAIVTSETITQHVKNLRAKLGPLSDHIKTVETLGYKYED